MEEAGLHRGSRGGEGGPVGHAQQRPHGGALAEVQEKSLVLGQPVVVPRDRLLVEHLGAELTNGRVPQGDLQEGEHAGLSRARRHVPHGESALLALQNKLLAGPDHGVSVQVLVQPERVLGDERVVHVQRLKIIPLRGLNVSFSKKENIEKKKLTTLPLQSIYH